MKPASFVKASIAVAGLAAATIAAFTVADVGAAGEVKHFAAGLLGSNEVGAADPEGTGSATVSVDTGTNQICWDIKVTGIGAVAADHIHKGAAGVNGPVVVSFNGALAGCATADPALAADIAANPAGYYVNVHTAEFTGGAIRGQLAQPGTGPNEFFTLPTPVRVYDSRQAGGGRMAPNTTRTVQTVVGKNGGVSLPAVPVGAVAAQVVITVTETGSHGYLTAHAAGTPVPEASVINWTAAGSELAAGTVVPLDATGRLALSSGPTSDTHVIVDVMGYYMGRP